MRIYFNSLTLPKKAAKRVQKHFTPPSGLGEKLKLSDAKNITAWMLGYDHWHELEKVTTSLKHTPSPVDEDATPEEQKKRINYQADTLKYVLPGTEPLLREIALELRVSAGNPQSREFSEDGYRNNAVFYWEPCGEPPEWRFRCSIRYSQIRQHLYTLIDRWSSGEFKLNEYKNRLDKILKEQPENLTAYLYILEACVDIEGWIFIPEYLPRLENAIQSSLPPEYPMKKKVPSFIWGTIENRDFLRSIYFLAQGYYISHNYKKAKQWFLFLTRCSPMQMGLEKYYLKDIRRSAPYGDLHLMEARDILERFEYGD